MLSEIFLAVGIVAILMCLHELGHMLAARVMGMHIENVGFKTRPYPHPYVEVRWTFNRFKRQMYLYAGPLVTLLLFSLAMGWQFFAWEVLYFAFAIQIIIETNPFYSDFVLLVLMERYKSQDEASRGEYLFSSWLWYLHFVIWGAVLVLLLSPKYLHSLFF